MSLTAGYDVVIELSRQALRGLVLRDGSIGPQSLVPEFELPPVAGSHGDPHVIIRDITIDLAPLSNRMTLHFHLHRSTIGVPGRAIHLLAGTITLANLLLELRNVFPPPPPPGQDPVDFGYSRRALHIGVSKAKDVATI